MLHLSMTWSLKKAWHVVKSCDLVFSMMLPAAVATFYCLDIMSGQSEFWPDKCGKWPEIGQWPAAISSSGVLLESTLGNSTWLSHSDTLTCQICQHASGGGIGRQGGLGTCDDDRSRAIMRAANNIQANNIQANNIQPPRIVYFSSSPP